MNKNIRIIIGVVAITILLVVARFIYATVTKPKAKSQAPYVVTDIVKEDDVIQSFDAPGRVVSKYQVSIMARISGYLQKSFFKEGDYVKAGDTLFLIEPVEYQNASNVAGADIQNIKAQLEYANKQLVRAEELVKQDYIAKSRYDEILANRNALQAQLKAAQSTYNDSNRNLSYTMVKAPVDGRIGIIDVTIGNYVTPSSGSLTTINSTNPIYVTFPLSSEDFATISSNSANANETRKVAFNYTTLDEIIEAYTMNAIVTKYRQYLADNDTTIGDMVSYIPYNDHENEYTCCVLKVIPKEGSTDILDTKYQLYDANNNQYYVAKRSEISKTGSVADIANLLDQLQETIKGVG